REAIFYEPHGAEALVERLNAGLNPIHPVFVIERDNTQKVGTYDTRGNYLQIAFQFVEAESHLIRGFVNTSPANRGTHINGMRVAISQVINRWVREKGLGRQFSGHDILPGLTAVVNYVGENYYWDLRSSRLASKEQHSLAYDLVHDAFSVYAN